MIFEYRLKNGLLLCTCDTSKSNNPIEFSDSFPAFKKAQVKQIKGKSKKEEMEVKENGINK